MNDWPPFPAKNASIPAQHKWSNSFLTFLPQKRTDYSTSLSQGANSPLRRLHTAFSKLSKENGGKAGRGYTVSHLWIWLWPTGCLCKMTLKNTESKIWKHKYLHISFQLQPTSGVNHIMCRAKIFYTYCIMCTHMCRVVCVCGFHISSPHSSNILPATGFQPDRAHKVLGGSEGCSSQWIPPGNFPPPQKRFQQPRPWSTAGRCTGCCSTGTETAGKSCCSRWSQKPGQACSPCALCWWQREYPGWPYVPLERKKKEKQHCVNVEVYKMLPLNSAVYGLSLQVCRASGQGPWAHCFLLWWRWRRVPEVGVTLWWHNWPTLGVCFY